MHDRTVNGSPDRIFARRPNLMPNAFGERALSVLKGNRLTRQQYVGLLGQLYHFSAAAQKHLRRVSDRIDDPGLARWFVQHAREENGHHRWAELDLRDL